jgi:gliding motility-associated-like protein
MWFVSTIYNVCFRLSKVFTPNGDGYNDLWKIKIWIILPKTNLFIFNRYGKLLKQLNTSDLGWNGTLMEFHYLLMIIGLN